MIMYCIIVLINSLSLLQVTVMVLNSNCKHDPNTKWLTLGSEHKMAADASWRQTAETGLIYSGLAALLQIKPLEDNVAH